ncbi:MAG: hypothetical protein U9Q67_03395, partial [Patescibacteria group bacterium]|nr:hypothetical protein [Patescibacteria group bacterium]
MVKYCNRGWWRTGWVNLVYKLKAEGVFTRNWSQTQSGGPDRVVNGEEAKHIATYNLGNGSGKSDTVPGSAYLEGYKPESDNPNVKLSMNDSGLFAITFYTEPWGSTKGGNSKINKSEGIKNITEHNVSAPNNDTKFSVGISVDCIGCPHPVKYRDLNGDGIVECGQYIAWMDGFIKDTGPIDYILYAAMNATPPSAYIDNITNETGVNVRGGVALFGENVTFKGHGEPDDENNIVDWFWKSHKDGRIGSNASFTTSFLSPANPHHIYFYVKSKAGLWSPSSPESRDKIIVNKPPTAFIRHIKGRTDDTGQIIAVVDEEVEFSGFGFDTDGYINESGYEWYIDDDLVNNTPIFSHIFNGTDVGSHIVTFRVKDDKGTWSKNVSKEITVIRNPVLLVHDYLRSPSEMEKMKNALEEENYSVYTVDLRKPTDFIVEFTYPIDSPEFETLAAFGQLLISGRELESNLKELAAWHGGDDPEVVTLRNNIRNDIFNLRSALYLIRGRVEDQPDLKAAIDDFDKILTNIESNLTLADPVFEVTDFEDIIKDLKSKFKFEYKVVDNKEYKIQDLSIPVPVPDKAKPILQGLIATGKIKIPGQATIFSKEMTYKKDELSATAGLKLILKDIRPEFGDDGVKLKGSLYISDISFELDPPDPDSMPYTVKFAEAKFDATFVDGEVKAEAIIPKPSVPYPRFNSTYIIVTNIPVDLRELGDGNDYPVYQVKVEHYDGEGKMTE